MRYFGLSVATLLSLTATQLAAQTTLICSFNTECIETESCEATSYDVTITHKDFTNETDAMDASAVWTDDASTHTLFLRNRPDILFGMWSDNDGRQFGRLMTDGAGDARYVMMDASIPMMISYYGTCKEAK